MLEIFRKKTPITVIIKLYSGIHREMNLENYDLGKGLVIQTLDGIQLRTILKGLEMKNRSSYSYFLHGSRISQGKRLHNGDEVSCLKPSGGG